MVDLLDVADRKKAAVRWSTVRSTRSIDMRSPSCTHANACVALTDYDRRIQNTLLENNTCTR